MLKVNRHDSSTVDRDLVGAIEGPAFDVAWSEEMHGATLYNTSS